MVLAGLMIGLVFVLFNFLPVLIGLAANTLYLAGMLIALGAILYIVLDDKARNLVWYMYKSVMRSITGIFVKLDPISILKSYVDDLRDNLGKMNKQIARLRSQMHLLKEQMYNNAKQINSSLSQAADAQKQARSQ